MDISNIWNEFLNKVNNELSPMLYETWFADTKLIDLKDNKATVLVPMHIHKKHLKENYKDLIDEKFNEVTGSIFDFEYVTNDEKQNVEIEVAQGVPSNIDFESNLNPNYTFDSFIVGSTNKFARTSALAVAEKPGLMYNPLFIYGNSGLGKTHLMHSIGNYVIKNSNKKVLYVTSEQFVSDFIDLYRKDKVDNFEVVENFKKKYRDIDVLMIDDIQYLEMANKTQQEFFNTFNDLHTKNKQIIIASDRCPDDLKQLEERLRTRFNWGLTIDILPPDFDLRLAIINKKLEGHTLEKVFPDEVKEYIASNCISDVRKLEGAITRVLAFSTMMGGTDITIDVATEALKDYFVKSIISKNKIDQVMQVVSTNYNISVEDMKSKKRVAIIAVPRQIAMYIARTVLNESLPKIGLEFGGKDHTTVMHSVDKIKKLIEKDPNFKTEVEKLINKINN